MPEYRSLVVPRHARVGIVGDPATAREAWLILHGYAMLAQGILHWFEPAQRDDRVLIAPEGLSRFYVEDKGIRRVGASWMTREDRAHEMADILTYLDAVVQEFVRPTVRLEVHGFSQGVTTGARWLVHGSRRVDRFVGWGWHLPEDVTADALRQHPTTEPIQLLVGSRDTRIAPDRVQADADRLAAAGIPTVFRQFDGGHRVDREVLRQLAHPDAPPSRA